MADLCLDEFTDHGHCGVLDDRGRVDNDATLERYAAMALAQADAGAHVVGPSRDDGRPGRRASARALDAAGRTGRRVLAYAAKYASALLRAVPRGGRVDAARRPATYQQDPANARESLREVRLDLAEGADIVMVKPALPYLDVVVGGRGRVDVPVAAYQVSGEYAMIEAAAAQGWIDRDRAVLESLTVDPAGRRADHPDLLGRSRSPPGCADRTPLARHVATPTARSSGDAPWPRPRRGRGHARGAA